MTTVQSARIQKAELKLRVSLSEMRSVASLTGGSFAEVSCCSCWRICSCLHRRSARRIARVWWRSTRLSASADAQLHKQTSAPNHSATLTEAMRAIAGLIALFTTDPRRENERFTPSAIASSLPWNHCATTDDCATAIDSPPSPKSARPRSITLSDEIVSPSAKSTCPPSRSEEKSTIEKSMPTRSTRRPPSSGKKMLGNE
mmetsp:Transcript_26369/g.57771  ORF Transcript_26369/g.57771 Transcript_26369/m.57771 type:complete len:201 (+) Transcript_26369:629-1231(+)